MLNCAPQPYDFDVYQPRKPGISDYYRCVEAHFEDLEAVWDDRYARKYGFWRPYVMDVICRYLNCGDLHFGFVPAGNALGVPELNVKIAVMNIYCRFPVSEGIFVRPVPRSKCPWGAIKNGWWNSVNGLVKKC